MSTEYYNSQWQMPNESNKSKQANHSLQAGITTSGERVDITNLPFSDSKSWTISFWVKPTTISAANLTFGGSQNYSGAGGFIFYLNSGGSITFYSNPNRTYFSFATGNNVVSADTWHHVIFTYNYGVDYRIYVDGVLQAVSTGNGGSDLSYQWPTQNFGLFEKALPGYTGYSLKGALCDWCFFNYALSDTATSVGDTATGQIAQLYGNGSSLSNPMDLSPAPKVYYPLSNSVWNGSSYITANNAVQDYVFDFSGALGESVITTSSYMPTSNFTVSLWFKHTMATRDNYIFAVPKANNSTQSVWIYTLSGQVRITVSSSSGNADCQPSVTVNDGKWHQITATFDSSGNLKCFIDGSNETTSPQSPLSGTVAYGDNIGIGGYWTTAGSGSTAFDGEISNVLVLDTVLTATEAQTLYNYGSPIQTLANIPQSSNLKAWYKLDASEIYNSSSTEWEVNEASSFWKNSVDFNLTNSSANRAYIQCANTTNLNLTGAMTLSAWMKGDQLSSGNYNGLGTQGGGSSRGYALLRGTNFAYFSISDNGSAHRYVGSPANTWKENEWNHVVGVFDPNSRFEVYVNGVFSAAGANYAQQTSTNPFQIGSRGDGSHYYNWLGQLSNVSIWNTALSNGGVSVGSVAGGEIATLYNGGEPLQNLLTGPQNSNLLSWWKLDNITTGIQDSKGTNNGTIVTLGDGLVDKFNQSVSTLNGQSSGMSRSSLVQSDLSRVFNERTLAFHGGHISTARSATNQSGLLNPSGSSFSLSIWFRNVSSGYGGMLSKKDGAGTTTFPPTSFGMFKDDNSASYSGISAYAEKLVFVFTEAQGSYDATNSIGSAETIQVNKWYNVVVTHTPGNTKMYLNGSVDSTSTSITKSSFPDGYFTLSGCFQNGLNWRGALSNLSFFDTVLSAAEVREIWNNGLPGDLNQHSKVDQLKDWIGIGSNYSGFTSSYTCLINYKKAPNMYGSIGALYGSTWNTIGTTGFGDFTGTSSGFTIPSATVTNIVTNAPYSDKNAVSVGMWNQYSSSQPNATITSGRSTDTPQAT